MKFDISGFFASFNTLHEGHYTFLSYLSQFFLEWEMFRQKLYRNLKHIFSVRSEILFDNRAFYEKKWKNFVERGSPQVIILCILFACWTSKSKTHTLGLRNTHCFSTATTAAWTKLNVTWYLYWPSCFSWMQGHELRLRDTSTISIPYFWNFW